MTYALLVGSIQCPRFAIQCRVCELILIATTHDEAIARIHQHMEGRHVPIPVGTQEAA